MRSEEDVDINSIHQSFAQFSAMYLSQPDSALNLLKVLRKQIDLDQADDTSLEYYLRELKLYRYVKSDDQFAESIENGKKAYQNSKNENKKLSYEYHEYFQEFKNESSESQYSNWEKLIAKAIALQDKEVEVKSILAYVVALQNGGKKEEALHQLDEAIEMSKAAQNEYLLVLSYLRAAYIYSNYTRHDDVIKNYELALEHSKNVGSILYDAKSLNGLAITNRIQGRYHTSLQYFQQSLAIYNTLQNSSLPGIVRNNMGSLYLYLEDYDKALSEYNKALEYFDKSENKRAISFVNSNIGAIYVKLGDSEKAYEYLTKSIEQKKAINEKLGLLQTYNFLGEMYFNQNNLSEAAANYKETLKLCAELDTERELPISLLGLGKINKQEGKLIAAESYFNQALEKIRNSRDLDDEHECINLLAEVYHLQSKYKKSFEFLQKSIALKDSIASLEKAKEINRLSFDYENQRDQLEQKLQIARLKTDSILKDSIISSSKQRFAFFAVLLFCSLLLLCLLFRIFLQKRAGHDQLREVNELLVKTNSKLELNQNKLKETNTNLSNFAGIAAHDLKAPLRTISGFTSLLSKKYKDEIKEKDKEYFEMISGSAKKLSKMIEDLLVFTRVDQELPEPKKIHLMESAKSTEELLKTSLIENNASLKFDLNHEVIAHPSMLNALIQNIIQNSLKFSHADRIPVIEVKSEISSIGKVLVSIKDNGIGIKEKNVEEIFQGFKKLHREDEYEGTGIGLATCKKIVQFYDGKIWAESEEGIGTTIKFELNAA